ncbi:MULTISPECIES: hypothetical protein [Eisenbergiella]|uniref:Uncharacterized protein n=1 Tax=Eisenbergiella porci TaxID=2652274 RepID=A0A6N7W6J7_9FIRM|nr:MULTISPECIES: hypothetical protein [Eisenbergiella]MDY2652133.1 hypothetical protein [Eisenbergiella porci]MSS90891.1 hypothetical protein [Eisenbergiella porci]
MKKHGFQNEEKREESYKALIREFYEEVYDWSVSETEELGKIWTSQMEEMKMPQSVIVWCKKLIEAVCDIKREKMLEGVIYE